MDQGSEPWSWLFKEPKWVCSSIYYAPIPKPAKSHNIMNCLKCMVEWRWSLNDSCLLYSYKQCFIEQAWPETLTLDHCNLKPVHESKKRYIKRELMHCIIDLVQPKPQNATRARAAMQMYRTAIYSRLLLERAVQSGHEPTKQSNAISTHAQSNVNPMYIRTLFSRKRRLYMKQQSCKAMSGANWRHPGQHSQSAKARIHMH